jgi:N-acetylglucosamine kinase-like BadF-type ATPase
MPLTGTDSALAALIKSKRLAKLDPAQVASNSAGLDAMNDDCAAIAEAVIAHLLANVTLIVAAGIPVATAGGPAAQTGATTAPGTGTIT